MKIKKLIWIILGLVACINLSFGQNDDISPYPDVNENDLIETKWKYTYALHVESNTAIHQADDDYSFFIYLKYDYSYEQFLNGKSTRGNWSIDGSTLFYNFKHIKKFFIAEASRERLVLEFKQPNSKGTYQYHFIQVESKDAPFIRPPNELPEVDVIAENPNKKESRNKKKRKKRNKKNKNISTEEDLTYISIELIGGGYYGGIDPVLKDFIQIKNTGRLIKEFQSVERGLVVTKKDIPREELEAFAEFIKSKKFFELNRIYDCEDELCQKRKGQKPTPVPLRVAVTYGNESKVITITVWGKDNSGVQYVPYPKELEQVILSIQKMADNV